MMHLSFEVTTELYCLLNSRGGNGELWVGVRRLMREVNNMPSSVISSHSMHLGVLATASHAISTGTLFSIFYKPRFEVILSVYLIGSCYLFMVTLLCHILLIEQLRDYVLLLLIFNYAPFQS
jgi:hypothetical protein